MWVRDGVGWGVRGRERRDAKRCFLAGHPGWDEVVVRDWFNLVGA